VDGRIRNSGIEAALNASVLTGDALTWNLSATGALPHNRVLTLGQGTYPILLTLSQREQAGYPIGGYWARPLLGYADRDGDGVISTNGCGTASGATAPVCEIQLGDTATYLGSPMPTRVLSFTSRWILQHRVILSALLDYRGGQRLYNQVRELRCGQYLLCRENVDRATPLAEQAKIAAFRLGSSAGYIEDASYWKLREISLQFVAPAQWATRIGASHLTLTLSGRNLYTWTRYSGFDPEVSFGGQDTFVRLDDFAQPMVRSFLTRLDIGW
jgi:hypothetical protein